MTINTINYVIAIVLCVIGAIVCLTSCQDKGVFYDETQTVICYNPVVGRWSSTYYNEEWHKDMWRTYEFFDNKHGRMTDENGDYCDFTYDPVNGIINIQGMRWDYLEYKITATGGVLIMHIYGDGDSEPYYKMK